MTRIVIADDHTMFLQGLVFLLKSMPGYEIVGEAGKGKAAMEIIAAKQPDIAVLDISMPDMSGLDIIREIKKRGLPTKVIIVTMHTEPELAKEALKEGGAGFLLKENAFDDLLHAIRSVQNGGTFISPTLAASMFSSGRKKEKDLTQRERQILELISKGLTNKQMANALFISVKTVETHRARVIAKLGLRSTAELVRYAIRKGISSL